jgi:hypothetical protein
MKLLDLHEEASQALKLYRDNPGGSWLKGKREFNAEQGVNQFGVPSRFGPVTGSWNRNVLIPVSIAAKIPGVMGEQDRVRPESIKALTDIMSSHKLPRMSHGDQKQYAPFITVWQDGRPFVSEGNHRIMVAKRLGWKYIPIDIRYFSGAEDEDGILSPAKVKAYDQEGIAEGYDPTEFTHKS